MSKPNKQTAVSVENAEQLLERFERERVELVERRAVLAEKRRTVAFDAHAGDGSASKLLDGLHREAAELESRIAGLDDAVAEAGRRVAQAREAEARQQDRAQALQLREQLAAFIEAGKGCDAALELLVSASQDMRNALTEMNRLGASHPSHAQLDSLGALALRTALTQTSWVRYFERVSPVERKTFVSLVTSWAAMVERNIQQRLGDQTNEAA